MVFRPREFERKKDEFTPNFIGKNYITIITQFFKSFFTTIKMTERMKNKNRSQ
jgi:hypothetical protein